MDPRQIARYTADRAWGLYARRREIRSQQQIDDPVIRVARYEGYRADEGLHYTDAGPADLMLTNSGLEAGQVLEWNDRHIDAMPRRKQEQQPRPVFGGEDPIWAIAFSRRYFEDLVPFLGERRSTKVWFVSNAIREPQLLLEVPSFDMGPNSAGYSVTEAPKVYLFMAMDSSGKIYLDAKTESYYVQDIFGSEEFGGYRLFVNQNLTLNHWVIEGSTITPVLLSGGWKAPFTNSPTNIPLGDPGDYPSCQGWAWGDRMQYQTFQYTQTIDGIPVPVGPFQHQYTPGERSHNLLTNQNNMIVIPKPLNFGSPSINALSEICSTGQITGLKYKISDSYCAAGFSGFNLGSPDTKIIASFPSFDIDTPTRNTSHPMSNNLSVILSQSLIDCALTVLER